jgi:hypothetical protein
MASLLLNVKPGNAAIGPLQLHARLRVLMDVLRERSPECSEPFSDIGTSRLQFFNEHHHIQKSPPIVAFRFSQDLRISQSLSEDWLLH